MKILLAYPGKLNTVPMGRFACEALIGLGHEVIDFDLSSRWHDKLRDGLSGAGAGHASLNRRFRRTVERERPDLMLTVFGFDLSEESLDLLKRRGIPRACWWLNDPFQFSRSLAKAAHYDFLFTNSMGSVADYRQAGAAHAYWLPTACAPSVHRRVEAAPEYRCEVCFAGDWSPLRQHWCETLAEHFDVRVFGPWRRKLTADSPLQNRVHDGFFTPDDMARFFASADVVFNLHSWHGKWDHGTNPRLFEAAGCGACQAVDWKRDIPALFDCETEFATYLNMDDVIPTLRELLDAPERRRLLSGNAQRRAYAEHTYEARMKTLLETVGRRA